MEQEYMSYTIAIQHYPEDTSTEGNIHPTHQKSQTSTPPEVSNIHPTRSLKHPPHQKSHK